MFWRSSAIFLATCCAECSWLREGTGTTVAVVPNCATSPVPRLLMIDNLQISLGTSLKSRAESEGQGGSSTLAPKGARAPATTPWSAEPEKNLKVQGHPAPKTYPST